VAAVSVARRVAQEMGVHLGDEVCFATRFCLVFENLFVVVVGNIPRWL
jgi:hypothetical protein